MTYFRVKKKFAGNEVTQSTENQLVQVTVARMVANELYTYREVRELKIPKKWLKIVYADQIYYKNINGMKCRFEHTW